MKHADLIDRLNAGSGPDRRIERDVAAAAGYAVKVIKAPAGHDMFKEGGGLEFMSKGSGPNVGIPPYTQSLDACIGLMREVLPGAIWRKSFDDNITLSVPKTPIVEVHHEDTCRALLIAILQAVGEKS